MLIYGHGDLRVTMKDVAEIATSARRQKEKKMNRRTHEEMKAYVDGYCDAVSQFCECIRKADNIKDAVEKMMVFVNVVNAVIEKPDNIQLAINLVEKNEEGADKEEGEEEKKQPCGKCIHFNRCWEEREYMYIEADKDGKCPRYKEGAEK